MAIYVRFGQRTFLGVAAPPVEFLGVSVLLDDFFVGAFGRVRFVVMTTALYSLQ
jgi:hypothetical protein